VNFQTLATCLAKTNSLSYFEWETFRKRFICKQVTSIWSPYKPCCEFVDKNTSIILLMRGEN